MNRWISIILPILFKLWGNTWQISVSGFEKSKMKSPQIFVLWHEVLAVPLYFLRKQNLITMASLNRDGAIAAVIGKKLGYTMVRGSSTRGGKDALAIMIKLIRDGQSGALTVDGPRGPRHMVKPGAVVIAQKANAKIIPVGVFGTKMKKLEKSWDKFKVFYPFSKIHIHFGNIVEMGKDFDENCQKIASAIRQAQDKAKQYFE